MAKILNKPVLEHIYKRVSKSNFVFKTIIATTTNNEDDLIEEFCNKNKIHCFRGPSEDVLERIYKATKDIKCDAIIEIGGDCPLVSKGLIEKGIRVFLKNKEYDVVSNALIEPFTYPDGFDFILIKKSALKIAHNNANLASERYQPFQYIVRNQDKFKIKTFKSNSNLNHWRWTLDYKEDFLFIREIYKNLKDIEDFGFEEIRSFLIRNPSLLELNKKFSNQRKVNSAWSTHSYVDEVFKDIYDILKISYDQEKQKEFTNVIPNYKKVISMIEDLISRAKSSVK